MKSYSVHMKNCLSDVQITGRVSNEPQMRYTPAGQAVTNVSIAVSRSWKKQDSEEWQEQTSFLGLAVWGDAAERASKLVKGDIVIAGFSMADLRAETFTGTDGEAKVSIKVGRANVQLFAHGTDGGEMPAEETEAEAAPEPAATDPIPF